MMIIDDREHNVVIKNRLTELGIEYESKRLLVGDYIWGNWAAERKTINDFLNSSVSGRLYEQLENMIKGLSEGAERAILIIHGNLKDINKRYFQDIDFFNILGQILVEYSNVSVVFLPNEIAVADLLASMYYKTYQPDQPVHIWRKKVKDPSFEILRSTKVFSIKQARELLRHYSLQEIFNLPDKELKSISFIGSATAKKFITLRKKK